MSVEVPVRVRRAARPRHQHWSPTRALWLDLSWIQQHLDAMRRNLAVRNWPVVRLHADAVHELLACHIGWEIDLLSRMGLATAAVREHDRVLDAVRSLARTLAAVPPAREEAPAEALRRLEVALAEYGSIVESELYVLVERDARTRRDRAALAAGWRRAMALAHIVTPP